MGQLHNLNVGFGDASVIVAGSDTFLIDCHKIEAYVDLLPANKHIRGVFITHQHRDHFSGLGYLMSNKYSIAVLVYSPYERRYGDNSVEYDEWFEFNSYKTHFQGEGTKVYAPYRQQNFDKAFWSVNGVDFWVLGPAYHIAKRSTRELHDGCLVIHVRMGARKCLFAGDASDMSLEYIANNTTNICDNILHASHHGSLEGACLPFIKKCNMDFTVISTKSGVYQNIPHPSALRRYRDYTKKNVYRTDTNGTLKWTF